MRLEDFRHIAGWIREREQVKRWDEQLDGDTSSGKLDFLLEEADEEAREGFLRDWPPLKRSLSPPEILGTLPRFAP